MLGILLLISILANIYLGYSIYSDKKYIADLEEECDNLEYEKDEIEKEAENYYKMGNQKLRSMKEENKKILEEKGKLEELLNDTNKKLDISINERCQLERKISDLEEEVNQKNKEITNYQANDKKETLKQEEQEKQDLTLFSKEDLLNYFKEINKLILNNDNKKILDKISEIVEYEKKLGIKTKKIITASGKLSYKNLLIKIEELEK